MPTDTRRPPTSKLLFVCLGNICRSPTAEAVMRHLVAEAGLANRFELDSAGTGGWHAGAPPDRRSAAAARARGVILDGSARRVTAGDFAAFDLLLAMDSDNHRDLLAVAPTTAVTNKVRLLREFDPASVDGSGDLDVPDPYYGGPDGFNHVIDLIEAACQGLLNSFDVQIPSR